MTATEKKLMEISKKIGNLNYSAEWFTAQIADYIDINYSIPLEEMKISEFLLAIDRCKP